MGFIGSTTELSKLPFLAIQEIVVLHADLDSGRTSYRAGDFTPGNGYSLIHWEVVLIGNLQHESRLVRA